MTAANQHPEQVARDKIDTQLTTAGWCIQDKHSFDLSKGLGIAFKEYQTDVGPADYGLLINGRAIGIIEAKPADHGHKITSVEEQSTGYANAKPKFNANSEPLNFVIEATGEIIRLTDRRDPKPRAREVYNFPKPETFNEWISQDQSLTDLDALSSPDILAAEIVDNLQAALNSFNEVAESLNTLQD